MCDLLWSDPDNVEDWVPSVRGAGVMFGPKATQDFCHTNSVSLIARAHQLVQ